MTMHSLQFTVYRITVFIATTSSCSSCGTSEIYSVPRACIPYLVCHAGVFSIRCSAQVHHVVAANEYLAQTPCECTVNVLLRILQLQIHVRVHGYQNTCRSWGGGKRMCETQVRGRARAVSARGQVRSCSRCMHGGRRHRNAPLYSIPHLSLTMMGLPVNSLRKGFGFTMPAMCARVQALELSLGLLSCLPHNKAETDRLEPRSGWRWRTGKRRSCLLARTCRHTGRSFLFADRYMYRAPSL